MSINHRKPRTQAAIVHIRAVRDFVLTGITVFLMLASIFAGYAGYISPMELPAAALAAMTFPMFLVLDVVMAVLLLFMRRRLNFVMLATIIALVPAFNVYCPLHFSRSLDEGEQQRAFTVMTYNSLCFTDYTYSGLDSVAPNRTLSLVLEADPDIVCFQECRYARPSRWIGITDSMVTLLNRRYPYRTASTVSSGAVYSKFPITRIIVEREYTTTANVHAYRLNVRGRLLTLVNVHLQSIGLSNDDKALYRRLTTADTPADSLGSVRSRIFSKLYLAFEERTRQSDSIVAIIGSRDDNVIVCGDFNDVPGCFAVRNLMEKAGMRDAYADGGTGPGISYRDGRMYFRIDQILYRGAMHAAGAERIRGGLSDHYPVMATFVWDDPSLRELYPDSNFISQTKIP